MAGTTIIPSTVGTELTKSDPNRLADLLRQVDLGNLLQVKSYDTGTIAGTASVTLPEEALVVASARIVTATTATKVGTYMVTPDTGVTRLTAATSGVVGLATLGADRKTVTFEATDATRVVVWYVPAPKVALSTATA